MLSSFIFNDAQKINFLMRQFVTLYLTTIRKICRTGNKIMQHLIETYCSYNISAYPEPIKQLIEIHRIQCLRRHYRKEHKLLDTKIILALPWQDALAQYTQEIRAEQVHSFYDHVIFLQDQAPQTLASQPLMIENPESYLIVLENQKPKLVMAPKGVRLATTEYLKPPTLHCIQRWFSADEVYFLI